MSTGELKRGGSFSLLNSMVKRKGIFILQWLGKNTDLSTDTEREANAFNACVHELLVGTFTTYKRIFTATSATRTASPSYINRIP